MGDGGADATAAAQRGGWWWYWLTQSGRDLNSDSGGQIVIRDVIVSGPHSWTRNWGVGSHRYNVPVKFAIAASAALNKQPLNYK